MSFNVDQNGVGQLGDCVDGFKLDIEGVEPEVEDFEPRYFEEEDEGVLKNLEECFSEFVSAGDFLVDEKLGKVADDVLKLDFERTAFLIKHLIGIDFSLLSEERPQFGQFFLALNLMELQRELQVLNADLLWFWFHLFFGHC